MMFQFVLQKEMAPYIPIISNVNQYSTLSMDVHYQIEKRDPHHHWAPALNNCLSEYQTLQKNPPFDEQDFFAWVNNNKPSLPKTRYLSPDEVDDLKLSITSEEAIVNAKTLNKMTHGMQMFVMTKEGQFYLHPKVKPTQDVLGFNHSSFFQGEDVSAVGFLHFDAAGKLIGIDNYSGHYKPQTIHVINALAELAAKGVDLNEIQYHHRISTDSFDKEIFNAKTWYDENKKISLKPSL